MIHKKELLTLVTAFGLLLFALSGEDNKRTKAVVIEAETTTLANTSFISSQKLEAAKIKRISQQQKALKVFQKRLSQNNLTETLKNAKSLMPANPKKPSASVPKIAKKKKAKKKDDEKKKKDDKKVAKKNKPGKDSSLKPLAPSLPETAANIEQGDSKIESKDLSSISLTSTIPSAATLKGKNTEKVENEDETETAATAQNEQSTVSNFGSPDSPKAQKSIFTRLLEEGRFSEFSQMLNSNLSEKSRIQAYTDAVNVLFSSSDENAAEYNAFIYNDFFNENKDKYAVVISKSMIQPQMKIEHIRYSVNYLNQSVIEWQSDAGNFIFKQIYQDKVSTILSSNEERTDLFTGLQSSIEAKSLSLSENSIEISAN